MRPDIVNLSPGEMLNQRYGSFDLNTFERDFLNSRCLRLSKSGKSQMLTSAFVLLTVTMFNEIHV